MINNFRVPFVTIQSSNFSIGVADKDLNMQFIMKHR